MNGYYSVYFSHIFMRITRSFLNLKRRSLIKYLTTKIDMMFRSVLVLFIIITHVFHLSAQDNLVKSLSGNASAGSKEKFQFTPVIQLGFTPVKNQGKSGTCWSYTGSSFLESEMIRMGKPSLDLAEMFTARCLLIEKAKNYVRMHGSLAWGDGGELHDVINLYGKYGAVPQSVYTGLHYGTDVNKFAEMQDLLKGMLDGLIKNSNGQLTSNWLPAFTAVVDSYLGKVPDTFEYNGKPYTPLTFARDVVGAKTSDYIELASMTSAPYFEQTFFPVPDNWSFDRVYNVPMNDLTAIIDNALKAGYTVGWATDVSEKYFSWINGIAFVPATPLEQLTPLEQQAIFNGPQPELAITDSLRQAAFDNYTTQDDHAMQIVGMSKDQNGKEYYTVKNSWGASNDYQGFLYVTKNYVLYKTTAIMVHKNALAADLRKKLKI
jgi:bleomycin hydrolase